MIFERLTWKEGGAKPPSKPGGGGMKPGGGPVDVEAMSVGKPNVVEKEPRGKLGGKGLDLFWSRGHAIYRQGSFLF